MPRMERFVPEVLSLLNFDAIFDVHLHRIQILLEVIQLTSTTKYERILKPE
ncbi:MAG: hypothetical protein ACI9XB_003502 [Gammaproteobacteria bacterium]|jgi:hypothetical protein